MPSTLRRIDGDAPIAPDIVPADWADCVPVKPANDAISREKLFAEIRHAAETVAPKVDNTFRATDVNDIPALDSSSRAWIRRAGTVFVFALISVVAAAVWNHHGDAARETVAGLVPVSLTSSSPVAEPAAAPAGQPAAEQQSVAAQPAATEAASRFPPEAEQQIQSLTRDLAAMTQQVEQLKAQIETLKANQQAAVAPTPPVARAPAPKPPLPKVTALPPRPVPVAPPPRPAYQPATQAAMPPPPAATAPPPAYQPPPYSPPPQATVQPNGEPIVRPPMPMPLSDRY